METVSMKSTSGFTSGLSMSLSSRWGGMIEESLYKKTRNSLFQLMSFVYSECSGMHVLHHIISFFRILQFIGPSFFCSFTQIWKPGTMSYTIMSLVSVFFHLIPPSARDDGTIPYLSIYIALLGAFFIFFFGSSFYYKEYATLPDIVPNLVYIFLSTFGYLLHPIAFQLCGELCGELFNGTYSGSLAPPIIVLILSIACFCVYTWLLKTVTSTSIMFNPCSLITVLGLPQLLIFVSTNLITFISAIAAKSSTIVCYVLVAVCLLLYAASASIPFIDGGFVYYYHSGMIMTSSAFGALMCIGCIAFIATKMHATEVVIFVMVGLWICLYFLSIWILGSQRRNALIILDLIEEDKENFSMIKSVQQFSDIVITGFQSAHPVCLSKDVFQAAVERWQTDVNVWVLYAKFVAIYPEEMQKLGWIQHQMMTLHISGATSKHIQEEILRLLRTRESNISPELKKKLNKISKHVQLVKHKLRHIWDLIIQGNMNDMGAFIDKTYEATNSAEAEYNHILRQYPNSRFVARSYARFVLEVQADHKAFTEWAEKAKLLQVGMQVRNDHAHELGLTYFPSLPTSVAKLSDSTPTNAIDSESQLLDIDVDSDEKNQIAMEQSIALREQIDQLSIPGVLHMRIQRICLVIIVFLLPIVAATIAIFILTSTFEAPMTYLHHVSNLRSYIFLTSAYSMRYTFEKLTWMDPRESQLSPTDPPPSSLGATWVLEDQFSYLLNQLTLSVQELSGLRSIARGNTEMNNARSHIFGETVTYVHYVSATDPESETTSVQIGVMDMVSQMSNLFTTAITADVYQTSMIANPTANAKTLADSVSLCLSYITQYMEDNDKTTKFVFLIIVIVLAIVFPIVLLIFIIIEIRAIDSNKRSIYKCLTSLPKNVVSSVADSLKMMKGEHSECSSRTEDSEMNKQEENMLKIFATASDSSSKVNDNTLDIVCTFFSVGLCIAILVVIYEMFINMSDSIYEAAPNVDNIMGAFAYQAALVMEIYLVAAANKGHEVLGNKRDYLLTRLPIVLNTSLTYYQNARFGTSDGSDAPFQEFNAGILKQNEQYACTAEKTTARPTTFFNAYECLSLEMLYFLVENFLNTIVEPMTQKSVNFEPNNEIVWNIWEIETNFMFDKFFSPIFSEIVPSVDESLYSDITKYLIIIYVLFVCELIVEIVLFYDNTQEQNHMRFALKLLLHCPPSTVMQIPLITNVLSGNFQTSKSDAATRNKLFFDEVLGQLPDPLLIADESGAVVQINKQASRMFDGFVTIGTKVADFMDLPAFDDSLHEIRKQPPQEEEITFTDQSNTKFNLNVRSLSFNQMTAFIFRDITQTVRYNTLIDEERAKSDKLLESILPAKLVRRVQQGEKNISFSVQSASVVFMDIVSFTPWCGSNPATFVMDTLNKLYKEFDSLVAKYPTMTKIKCIGDCYMAAGGIFAEINQPAVHAKEIVEFGLDAIASIGTVNAETNQSLQIRVGINTGGPIVAGVLGSGKPTFEILGPAINMAQQMEHNGVPMNVHISRAVYELIYGGSFKIKERGQIEIKNGTVVTYLVSP